MNTPSTLQWSMAHFTFTLMSTLHATSYRGAILTFDFCLSVRLPVCRENRLLECVLCRAGNDCIIVNVSTTFGRAFILVFKAKDARARYNTLHRSVKSRMGFAPFFLKTVRDRPDYYGSLIGLEVLSSRSIDPYHFR